MGSAKVMQLGPPLVLPVMRKVLEAGDHYELRDWGAAYNAHFAPEKVLLSTKNTYYLDLNVE